MSSARYVALAGVLPDSAALLTTVRFILSFAVLIVPATLLGATLPLVAGSSAVRGTRVVERIGVLYATNTAGAIVGTLLAGFWMIGALGISTSFRVAASVNALVGLVAIIGSRSWETRPVELAAATGDAAPAAGVATPVPERTRRLVLFVFGLSGFVSIALEVVWFRVLVLYVESDTYAFTIMLASVLTGIAIGGYVGTAILHRWGARLAHLAVLEVAIALSTLASFALLAKSFTVNGRYGTALGVLDDELRFVVVAGGLTVLPTATLLGAAFPIGLALWTHGAEGGAETGRRVGTFYAVNVVSGIAGSLVAGFVLIPLAGSRTTLLLLAAATGAAGLALTLVAARLHSTSSDPRHHRDGGVRRHCARRARAVRVGPHISLSRRPCAVAGRRRADDGLDPRGGRRRDGDVPRRAPPGELASGDGGRPPAHRHLAAGRASESATSPRGRSGRRCDGRSVERRSSSQRRCRRVVAGGRRRRRLARRRQRGRHRPNERGRQGRRRAQLPPHLRPPLRRHHR